VLRPEAVHALLDLTDRCSSKAAVAVREQMRKASAAVGARAGSGLKPRQGATRDAGGAALRERTPWAAPTGGGGAALPEMQNNPFMMARAGAGDAGGRAVGGNMLAGGLGGSARLRVAAPQRPRCPPRPTRCSGRRCARATPRRCGALEAMQSELREAKVRLAVAGGPGRPARTTPRAAPSSRGASPRPRRRDASEGAAAAGFSRARGLSMTREPRSCPRRAAAAPGPSREPPASGSRAAAAAWPSRIPRHSRCPAAAVCARGAQR